MPLLALGFEAVGQQRQIDCGIRRGSRDCASRTGTRERCQLVAEHAARVVEQAPDQRALAVVDAARGDEAQHAAVFERRARYRRVHQKYPSFLRRSIEASLVWSSMRVAPRSVISARAVSAMICCTVTASLATGQVQLMSPTVRKRT